MTLHESSRCFVEAKALSSVPHTSKAGILENLTAGKVEHGEKISPTLFQATLSDHSGHQWVTSFQESAETLLNIKADELGDLRQNVIRMRFTVDCLDVAVCVVFQILKTR